jgi:bifunctional non-homologous end joining protein LigD
MGSIPERRQAVSLSIGADPSGDWEVKIGGRKLRVANPNKVLWPSVNFTKGQMVAYYLEVAPHLLPHLAGRPLTMKRAPDGVEGWYWFQTSCPHPPHWLATRRVAASRSKTQAIDYCVVNDLASLVWVLNLAAVELHPLLSRSGGEDEAEVIVFDLDPRDPAGMDECCRVALALRPLLQDAGFTPLVKTSGLAGLHVYGVLPQPGCFTNMRELAKSIGRRLQDELSGLVTLSKRLTDRRGRVLIDWSQNSPRRSMPAPYSLRAAAIPTVSTPIAWEEVRAALNPVERTRLHFSPTEVIRRLDDYGDLFASATWR